MTPERVATITIELTKLLNKDVNLFRCVDFAELILVALSSGQEDSLSYRITKYCAYLADMAVFKEDNDHSRMLATLLSLGTKIARLQSEGV